MKNKINSTKAMYIVNNYGHKILKSTNKQLEKEFIQHGNVTIYEHTLSVAILCIKISYFFNIDVDKKSLIRGALLHDYFLYDWHIPDKSHQWHGFNHASVALKNAKKEFGLNEIEKNMIFSHMFPLNIRVPKYKESIILCIADKICSTKETIHSRIVKVKKIGGL